MQRLTHVSMLVHDQQEAKTWYTEKLGWRVASDDPFPGDPSNRWITVAPTGQQELEVVLEPPHWGLVGDPEAKRALVGKMPGFVIETDDCRGDCEALRARGVQIVSGPDEMPWGISVVFLDLYGTAHNLLQPAG